MAKYRIYKNTNVKSAGYNKYYAHKAAGKLVELPELVQHMAGHNTAFSEGVIRGVITDMVRCVRELAYEGNQVKIENLGIFQVSMRSKGVTDPTKFDYTAPLIMLACLGVAALILGFVLKAIDKKKGIGLELPNITE